MAGFPSRPSSLRALPGARLDGLVQTMSTIGFVEIIIFWPWNDPEGAVFEHGGKPNVDRPSLTARIFPTSRTGAEVGRSPWRRR
jgi:hypothetical protein